MSERWARTAERAEALLPPLLFFAGFACYALNLGSWSGWLDSGELLTGAHHLGLSHPPGQPFYSLCAKAAMLAPVGGIAFRGALVSAAAGAGAWVLLYGLVLSLTRVAAPARAPDRWDALLAAATAVAFGLTAPVASESTRAEVYALTLCFVLGALRLVAAWLRLRDARMLPLAALLLGLAAVAHLLLASVAVVACGIVALAADAPRLARSLGAGSAALAAGAATLLLLPIRTIAGADFSWGAPDVWSRFLSTASARPYAGTYTGPGEGLLERIAGHLSLLEKHVGWEIGLLALAGLLLLGRRSWRALLLVLGVGVGAFGAAVAQRIFYAENPDVSGYLLPVVAVAFAGAALTVVIEGPRLPPRAEALLVLACAAVLISTAPRGLARGEDDAETYARAVLGAAPARAVVTAASDHAAFALLYAQQVEGERPDVPSVIRPLLTSSWYLRTLKRWAPDLFVPYVDDGRTDRLFERLIEGNAVRRTVLSEPVLRSAPDLGLVSAVAGPAAPAVDALAAWRRHLVRPIGDLSRRVLGFATLRRAEALADRGERGRAAEMVLELLGEEVGWLPGYEALARARALPLPARRLGRPVAPALDRFTPVFLYSDDEAAWRLGDLLYALGLPEIAEGWLVRSGTLEAQLVRAYHAIRSSGWKEAEHVLAGLGPRARDGRLAVARALDRQGHRRDALRLVEPLVKRNDDAAALAIAGAWEASGGNLRKAENLLRRALEIRSGASEPLTNLGLVYAKQGRFAEAEAAWREAALDPAAHRARALLQKLRKERR
jgi:tetratricopeptide (TPR) repeat protein